MRVYMLKDVENVGMSGQVVTVSPGYAQNFLFPRKLALEVTEKNLKFYQQRKQVDQVKKEVLTSKVAMVAERIKDLHVTLKERIHDDGKLYGSVSADQIVDALKAKDISVNRKQIEFDKAVRSIGEHKVTIKLTAKLKPQLTVKIVAQ